MLARVRTSVIAVVAAAGMLVAGAAAAQELQQKRTFGWRGAGKSHVQMRSVIAPVQPRPNAAGFVQTPVTVVLTVKDNSKVAEVCGLGPRIADALMQAWWQRPIPYDYLFDPGKSDSAMRMNTERSADQLALDRYLLDIINRAIGRGERVTEILVIKGSMSMGGGAISKLPFSSVLGCTELEQKEEEEKEKAAGH